MSIKRFAAAYASTSQCDDGVYVKYYDHMESHAYDEAKERELFEALNKTPRGIEWSLKTSRYIGSSDHFAISVYQSGWDGWKACAKSRAGIQS